jgi:hypothetical protein
MTDQTLTLKEARQRRLLAVFLRVYGVLSLILFSVLMLGFAIQSPLLDIGGTLHWTIWDRVSDHVGPMLFAIYIVWSIYLIKAAADPVRYLPFLDFTMWANLAHGLIMVPQALGMHDYHSKFLTDIPWILGLAVVLFILRPSPSAVERRPGHGAEAVGSR